MYCDSLVHSTADASRVVAAVVQEVQEVQEVHIYQKMSLEEEDKLQMLGYKMAVAVEGSLGFDLTGKAEPGNYRSGIMEAYDEKRLEQQAEEDNA